MASIFELINITHRPMLAGGGRYLPPGGQKESARAKLDGFLRHMWSRDNAFLQARWPMQA